MKLLTLFASGLCCAGASSALGQQVFFSDFNSGTPASLSGAGINESVQAYAGLGLFGGNFLRNAATGDPQPPITLTLTGLPAHTAVDINFLLAIIDSWDGIGGSPGPDTFVVRVNGTEVYSRVFGIASGTTAPGIAALGPLAPRGFNGTWGDLGYDMGSEPALTVPHTSSTLTVEFFARSGWQGSDDESWAIDNLQVVLIPSPTAGAFFGIATLGLAGRRRRA